MVREKEVEPMSDEDLVKTTVLHVTLADRLGKASVELASIQVRRDGLKAKLRKLEIRFTMIRLLQEFWGPNIALAIRDGKKRVVDGPFSRSVGFTTSPDDISDEMYVSILQELLGESFIVTLRCQKFARSIYESHLGELVGFYYIVSWK